MSVKDELNNYLLERAHNLREEAAAKQQEEQAKAAAEQAKLDGFTAYLESKLEGDTE